MIIPGYYTGDVVELRCQPSLLGLEESERRSIDAVVAAYRAAVKRTHPDAGGSAEAFQRVQRAYEQACAEIPVGGRA